MDTPIIKSEKIFLGKNPKFHIAIEAYKSLKADDAVWEAIGVLFLALTQARHDIIKLQAEIARLNYRFDAGSAGTCVDAVGASFDTIGAEFDADAVGIEVPD